MPNNELATNSLGDNSDAEAVNLLPAQDPQDVNVERAVSQPEDLPEDSFVPGVYEIMPRFKKAPWADGGRYPAQEFPRSRHHRSIPDRVVAGLNSVQLASTSAKHIEAT